MHNLVGIGRNQVWGGGGVDCGVRDLAVRYEEVDGCDVWV